MVSSPLPATNTNGTAFRGPANWDGGIPIGDGYRGRGRLGWASDTLVARPLNLEMGAYIARALGILAAELEEDDEPLSPVARKDCLRRLMEASAAWSLAVRLPLPDLGSLGAGDVQCHWRGGDRKATLSFEPDGTTRLFRARVADARTVDVKVTASPTSQDIHDALAWIAG